MLLLNILSYRLDFVLCAFLLVLVAAIGRRMMKQRSPDFHPRRTILYIAIAIMIVGGFLAEVVARVRMENLAKTMSDFVPLYAWKLKTDYRQSLVTPENLNAYDLKSLNALREDWLLSNPLIADIAILHKNSASGSIEYLLPHVLDARRDPHALAANPALIRAYAGEKIAFDPVSHAGSGNPVVTAYGFILTDNNKNTYVLGVDFFGLHWLTTIFEARLVVLISTLALSVVALGSYILLSLNRIEINERKAAETRLVQAKETADEANRAKSEFLAVMSHEIRTPLTAVIGFNNILAETSLNQEQRRYVSNIQSASERLTHLLGDVLDFSKIEDGKVILEHIPFKPAGIAHEVVDLVANRAREKNLALVFDDHIGPDLCIEGDPSRLRQVIVNLLTNAIKFTDHGSITLRLRWNPPPPRTKMGHFQLEVTDTGIGIPADQIRNLFNMFSQVQPGNHRRYGGSGLGLAICKRLAELMGGSISVQSALGEGTRFTFAIPASLSSDAVSRPETSPAATSQNANDFTTRHALVVEDHPMNRELFKLILSRLGFETNLASNGHEAIALCSAKNYDVVFMDIEMPGLDGYLATREIRKAEKTGHHTIIVAVTAITLVGTREKCMSAGMDDYLTKPVYLPALKNVLSAHKLSAPAVAAAV